MIATSYIVVSLIVAVAVTGVYWNRRRSIAAFNAEIGALQADLLRVEQEKLEAERVWLKERSDFLIVISHELRTPIGLITGYLDMFAEMLGQVDLSGIGEPEAVGNLKTFAEGAIRGAARLRIMLRLFSVMNDKPRIVPVDLCDVVYRAINQPDLYVATRRKPKDVPINVSCSPTLVQGDREMLETAVFEYCRNALKATRSGYIQIVVSQTAEHVVLSVEDNGRGIAYGSQTRIWEAGYQSGEKPDSRMNEGSGYGLSVVAHIAHLHGGEAALEWSELDAGSRFALYLPLS